MNTNLDNIALDLYGKIQTRFPNIKMGDENATVLSKRTDIPKARFFEFEYKDNGRSLGTVAITLDEDDGILVQLTGDIANKHHEGAFKFIRGLRTFAKDRLINFDVQNLAKDQLDKRDYEFQAKPKEEPEMQQPMQQQQQPAPKQAPKSAEQSAMMESKMYGTNRMSYQDLGEATLIIKHSQPINPEVAAGRTMHIEGIWVENAEGERFKYPYKHLNGARALAEHLKHGGTPYDAIGQHISSLSEELAQLRKFKGYVSRNVTLSEAMGGITDRVSERIEQVKREVFGLQRKAYYEAFAESFEARTDEMIPEEIMSDFIDRLTIRTFNEDLRQAFPYIFRLVDESEVPVKELTPDDLLAEKSVSEPQARLMAAAAHDPKFSKKVGMKQSVAKEFNKKDTGTKMLSNAMKHKKNKKEESYLEDFMNNLMVVEDDSQLGDNALFSPNKDTQRAAIDKFNEIMKTELKGGPNGINIIDSLKGLIDEPEFIEKMKEIDPDLDARSAIQQELKSMSETNPAVADIFQDLNFKGDGSKPGGEEVPPEAAPPVPDMGATPPPEAAPPVPDMSTMPPPEAAPPAGAEAGAMPPPEAAPAPMAEGISRSLKERVMAKLIRARESGATLEDKVDFGHREMTLHDCMRECGINPMECGFGEAEMGGQEEHTGDPINDMLKSIAGFWNKEQKNFTIGGTRAKVKVIKDFKNGEFKNATPEHVKHVIALIDRMDPSSEHNQELSHIKHLAGTGHNPRAVEIEVDSAPHQAHSFAESVELSNILKIAGVKK